MPEKKTLKRVRKAKRQGKRPTTQAGEFVREEMHHVREGKHGARSPKQAIAIALSKARRSGVPLGEPKAGRVSRQSEKSIRRDLATGQGRRKPRARSKRRSRAVLGA